MGNCFAMHKKLIKPTKRDGEVANLSISGAISTTQLSQPQTESQSDRIYYLFQTKLAAAEANQGSSGAVRIKIVITKQELKEVLSHLPEEQVKVDDDGDNERRGKAWRPVLESIPEMWSLQ